jgi:putative membrane protein
VKLLAAVLKVLVNVAGFYIAALVFPNIIYDQPSTLLWAGLVLGLVNILVRPLLMLLTLPIRFLTFGLFTLVINALMVSLTDYFIEGLYIPGFWYALAVSVFISILNMLFINKA